MASTRAKNAGKAVAAPARAKKGNAIPGEERERMIGKAAYYRAERRGFIGGDPLQDWLAAEVEIDRQLRKAG
jgi:hypothetical protein